MLLLLFISMAFHLFEFAVAGSHKVDPPGFCVAVLQLNLPPADYKNHQILYRYG